MKQRNGDCGADGFQLRLFAQLAHHFIGGRCARFDRAAGHELPRARVVRDLLRSAPHENTHAVRGDRLHAKRPNAAIETRAERARLLHRIEAVRALLHMDLHATVTVAAHTHDLQQRAIEIARILRAKCGPARIDLGERNG